MFRFSRLLCVVTIAACASGQRERAPLPRADPPPPPQMTAPVDGKTLLEPATREDTHLKNIRQLTLDGKRNGEAYFSTDGRTVLFHSVRGNNPFYQVFMMDHDGRNVRQVSPGRGKAVCAAFAPDRPRVLFASSHDDPEAWPAEGSRRNAAAEEAARQSGEASGAWDADPSLDIYEADLDGKNLTPLIASPGYDGEGSYSRDGKSIVFTSARDGDPELYIFDLTTREARRLTHAPGWDGAAFFSPDSTRIVFRSYREGDGTSDIFLIHADGSRERRVTNLGALAWDPFFHPDGNRIIFASNHKAGTRTPGENFDLFLVTLTTGALERITWDNGHDTLPGFSVDGKQLLWTTSRQGGIAQVFVADWQD